MSNICFSTSSRCIFSCRIFLLSTISILLYVHMRVIKGFASIQGKLHRAVASHRYIIV